MAATTTTSKSTSNRKGGKAKGKPLPVKQVAKEPELTDLELDKIADSAVELQAAVDSAKSPEEAAKAQRALEDLLIKHDLVVSKILDADPDEFVTEYYTLPNQEITQKGWVSSLYYSLAKANQCEAMFLAKSQPFKMVVAGKKAHIDVTNFSHTYLHDTIKALSETASRDIKGMERIRFKTAFCYGAVETIRRRLNETTQKLNKTQKQQAVAETKSVEEFSKRHFPNARVVVRKVGQKTGMEAGRQAGESIGLYYGVNPNAKTKGGVKLRYAVVGEKAMALQACV